MLKQLDLLYDVRETDAQLLRAFIELGFDNLQRAYLLHWYWSVLHENHLVMTPSQHVWLQQARLDAFNNATANALWNRTHDVQSDFIRRFRIPENLIREELIDLQWMNSSLTLRFAVERQSLLIPENYQSAIRHRRP